MEEKIKRIISEQEKKLGNTNFVWNHTQRVRKLCSRLAELEHADTRLLDAAAILHDISKLDCLETGEKHAEIGAEKAKDFLNGFSTEETETVCGIIKKHSDKGSGGTIEEQILQDADLLDKLGAVGIGTFFIKAGIFGKTHKDFLKKDFQEYGKRLNTQSAKKMFEERLALMKEFSERLKKELEGEI